MWRMSMTGTTYLLGPRMDPAWAAASAWVIWAETTLSPA